MNDYDRQADRLMSFAKVCAVVSLTCFVIMGVLLCISS